MFNTFILIEIFLKLIGVAWVIRWWIMHSRDSHAGRLSRVIGMAFLGAILLPVSVIILPTITLPFLPHSLWMFFQRDTDFFISYFWVSAITLYFTVFFIQLFIWLYAHISFRYMIAHAKPCIAETMQKKVSIEESIGKKIDAEILIAPVSGPFTYGVLHSVIILPQDYMAWDDARLLRVLAHELTHVARRDWLWKNIIDVMAMILWCMPGLTYLKSRFEWYIEVNADDGVLFLDENRLAYANDMLAFANGEGVSQRLHDKSNNAAKDGLGAHSTYGGTVLSIISGSYCYERIAAVLDGSRHRSQKPYQDRSIVSVLLAVFIWSAIALISLGPIQSEALLKDGLPSGDKFSDGTWLRTRLLGKVEPELLLNSQQQAANNHSTSIGYLTMTGCDFTSSLQPIRSPVLQPEPYFEELVTTYYEQIPIVELPKSSLLASVQQGLSWDIEANPALPSVLMEGNIAIRSVTPEYPRLARKNKIEGKVIAQFSILPNGQADDIRIAMAAPKHVFNQSVVKAIKASRFRPAQKDGHFVKTFHASQTFTFYLSPPQPLKGYKPELGQAIKTATFNK